MKFALSHQRAFLNGIGALMPIGLKVYSLVQQPDGKILIGGQFSVFNVNARTGIARFSNATNTFADFDGDGKTDIGYFIVGATSEDTGFWYISSVNGSSNFFRWGAPSFSEGSGDFPVAGYNNR